ncbi:MAG TPA: sensor histidine kinase [Pilimelia sp.]|nr:sensor histidine kinase [Pilimelia sp.]
MADSASRPPLGRPLRPGQLILVDCAVAAAFAVVLLTRWRPAAEPAGWLPYLLIFGMSLPLAARRLAPGPVFGVVLTATVAATARGVAADSFAAAAYAVYPLALTAPAYPWLRLPVVGTIAAFGVVASAVVGVPPPWRDHVGPFLVGATVLAGVWTVGRAVRDRRAYAERSARQRAAAAVTEERLRIARELHDIVAHSMGLITVQAAVARHVLQTRPAEVPNALRVIETTGRDALAEMRHLLGALRRGADVAGVPDLGPAPGMAGLPALAARAAELGVAVDLDVRGADGLPAGVELAVYRIVQEGLTNAVKHAAPARCRVAVAADGDTVTVEVADDGPAGQPPPGEGHGLIGMRERVMMYGGTFAAGPDPAGGFRIRARLPYHATGELT